MEVVGVAADATYLSLRDEAPPTLYVPVAQDVELGPSMTVSVRAASGSPALLARSVAEAITAVDRDIAITFTPLRQQVDAALVRERVVAMLSGFFGAVALLLAGLGLYGVTSYTVNRRRAEIGIRMALGASPGRVVRLVLSRVWMLVGFGVLAGLGVCIWITELIAPLLYGLEPGDPVTLTSAAAVLATIGILAGWLPAKRAARIDPANVLRDS
jgi:ABC-type antimicrobial peptide transport system permease subunit